MVRPKYTMNFRTIMMGAYQPAMFIQLISSLTFEECEILLEFINLAQRNEFVIFNQRMRYYFNWSINNECWNRFRSRGYYFHELLSHNQRNQQFLNRVPLIFPRGRPHDNENPFQCANREFVEETGLVLDDFKLKTNRPLIDTHQGPDGRNYVNKYWILTTSDEIECPAVSQQDPEIQERIWIAAKVASEQINPEQLKLLLWAQSLCR